MERHAPEFESLPLPLGDELLFSRISRFSLLIGEEHSSHVLHRLVGNRMHTAASGLPCGLSRLERYFSPNCPAADLLVEATHAPYFWPFLTDIQRTELVAKMFGARSGGLKFTLGIVASRIGAQNSLRFCPACKQSEEASGIAVWHRAHQLPGVLVCHVHGSPLFEASHIARLSRHRLFLPRDVTDAIVPPASSTHRRALLEVAKLSAGMLFRSLLPIEQEHLRSTYIDRLRELGLLTNGGSVRQADLVAILRGRWDSLANLPSYRWLGNGNWHGSVLRNHSASAHPLKHLLFFRALDLTPSEVMMKAMTCSQQDAETIPQSARANVPKKQEIIERSALLVAQGASCSAAAATTGISVQTVILAAARFGATVSRRPKRVDHDLAVRIGEELWAGQPLREIATKLFVSNSTVWRLLTANQELETQWNQARLASSRRARRERWLLLLSDNLTSSIKELRIRDGGTYAWLHRHDRVWLRSTVVARGRVATPTPPRNDVWIAKDFRLAIAVKALANSIKTAHPLNGRASRSRLLRELSCEAKLTKQPGRFPLLLGSLSRNSESVEQYQVRRVIYWTSRLTQSEDPPAAWRVMRLAGIRSNPPPSVVAALKCCSDAGIEHVLHTAQRDL